MEICGIEEVKERLKLNLTMTLYNEENAIYKQTIVNVEDVETVLSELEKKDKRLNRQFKLLQKKDKEIAELKADNNHQWEERCKLTFELENKVEREGK